LPDNHGAGISFSEFHPTDRSDLTDPSSIHDPHPSISRLGANFSRDPRAVQAPRVGSFLEFLEHHARVPTSDLRRAGEFDRYTFNGREALREPCRVLDQILGVTSSEFRVPSSELGQPGTRNPELGTMTPNPLKDSTLVLAGGAQFGKTILELFLAAYITSQRFLNLGVYLPDDGLADAIVDTKFRPVVIDNVAWFAQMTQIGKAVNKSGKAVNTKGAFLVTDGERKAVGMFRGLKKIPTSFSLDVVVRDEEDDIPRDKAKFLSGRLTASALRLQIIVGTQRVAGAGQNKQWEQGSQGVVLIGPADPESFNCRLRIADCELPIGGRSGLEIRNPKSEIRNSESEPGTRDPELVDVVPSGWINPEDHWPQICRLQLGDAPSPDDPQLSWEGDFRRNGTPTAEYTPDAHYYLAHPDTGQPLDRLSVLWHHRRPEKIKLRQWSFRISQLGCAAIDLAQIVAHWTRAVADADEMTSFCCDRLARPKSAAQSLTPRILQRSRDVAPFDFASALQRFNASTLQPARFAGLDTGDRCWFFLRETESAAVKRCARCDQLALGDVVHRVRALCESQGVGCLFIDERPAVSEARTLALLLNGLDSLDRWPRFDWLDREAYVSLPGGLTWDGRNRRWLNLRCALVRFSRKSLGAGIEQTGAEFTEGAQTKFVPLIECNRFETIDRAVREFLTHEENVLEVVNVGDAKLVRQEPSMRLPRRVPGAPGVLETLDAHLLTGSQRTKDEKTGELGDYVDGCDNHFLLADAYSALAETVCVGNRHWGGAVADVRGWKMGSNSSGLDRFTLKRAIRTTDEYS